MCVGDDPNLTAFGTHRLHPFESSDHFNQIEECDWLHNRNVTENDEHIDTYNVLYTGKVMGGFTKRLR